MTLHLNSYTNLYYLNPWLCNSGGKWTGKNNSKILIVSENAESNGHKNGRNSSRISWVAVAEKYGRQPRTQ